SRRNRMSAGKLAAIAAPTRVACGRLQNGASSSAVLPAAFFAGAFLAAAFFATFFFATFFGALLAAFFAGVFFVAAFFVAAFLAGAFFAAAFLPKRPRIGLPVSSISCCTSSSVSDAGSRSFGIRPLRRPSLM